MRLAVELHSTIIGALEGQAHDFDFTPSAHDNQKYQRIGGVVSLGRIAETLKKNLAEPHLVRLARMVTLAVATGNLDMHTKNIGVLHPLDDDLTLAPAYDVVPQSQMAGDGELALAVNRKHRHDEITRNDLIAEFASWGRRRAGTIADDALEALDTTVREEAPLDDAHPQLQQQILGFVRNLRSGEAGSPLDPLPLRVSHPQGVRTQMAPAFHRPSRCSAARQPA